MATRSQRLEQYMTYWLEVVAKPSVRGTTYAKYEMFVRLYLALRALRRRKADQAAERLAAGDGRVDNGLVFTTRHGTPIEPRNMARAFDLLSERAGLRRIRLHDTRHTCASLLAAAGVVHPRTVMSILEHSQIAVTMNVYTHVTTEEQRTAVGLPGGLLDRVPGQEEVGRSRRTQPSGLDLEQLGGPDE